MARAVGIEPTQLVLETSVLPLYEARIALTDLPIIANPARGGAVLLSFFVSCLLATVLTILFDFQTRLSVLSVLRSCVVQIVAHSTFQINTVIL